MEARPSSPASGVIVAGATSLVGRFLLPALCARGLPVHALSRRPRPRQVLVAVEWHVADIAGGIAVPEGAASLIHLAPLWLAPRLVSDLVPAGLRRVIAFGSTSRFTKASSADPREREVARRLAEGEERLGAICAESGVAWTVFRPTLIYGAGADRNVSMIARFTKRFGFFPVPGGGEGRRQPVHAEDLARACLAALDRPETFGKAYDLSGRTTLTYAEMVEQVARGIGRRPRVVRLPLPLLRAGARVARLWPGWRHVTPEMASRVREDLCFDHQEATRDFGFSPRAFAYPDGRT